MGDLFGGVTGGTRAQPTAQQRRDGQCGYCPREDSIAPGGGSAAAERSRRGQDGPRRPKNGPRTAQGGPRMAPRRHQTAPRRPREGPGPKTAPGTPRCPQDGPRRLQDGPKTASDALRSALLPPSCLHLAILLAMLAVSCLKIAFRRQLEANLAHFGSNLASFGGLKMAKSVGGVAFFSISAFSASHRLRSPKMAQDGPKMAPRWLQDGR